MFPYAGNSPLRTMASMGTPGSRSAYKDMSFSPFFTPNASFGMNSVGFTPHVFTEAGTPMWTDDDLKLLRHSSLGSRPTPSMKFVSEPEVNPFLAVNAKGRAVSDNGTSPSPRVVFKDDANLSRSVGSSQLGRVSTLNVEIDFLRRMHTHWHRSTLSEPFWRRRRDSVWYLCCRTDQ